MRLRPHGTDSGALSRSRNRLVNPLYAPPHPQKSFYLTPRSTPMQYQVIILAFRYLLASFGRGAAARPRWFYSELVHKDARSAAHGLCSQALRFPGLRIAGRPAGACPAPAARSSNQRLSANGHHAICSSAKPPLHVKPLPNAEASLTSAGAADERKERPCSSRPRSS